MLKTTAQISLNMRSLLKAFSCSCTEQGHEQLIVRELQINLCCVSRALQFFLSREQSEDNTNYEGIKIDTGQFSMLARLCTRLSKPVISQERAKLLGICPEK